MNKKPDEILTENVICVRLHRTLPPNAISKAKKKKKRKANGKTAVTGRRCHSYFSKNCMGIVQQREQASAVNQRSLSQ